MATGSVCWGSNGCEEKDGSSDQGTSPSSHVQIFILSGYHGRPTRGTVTIHDFNRAQRSRRALRGVSTWWSAGLLSVLVPVAHFVLVPSFLLYGIWQFVQRVGTAELATDARGTCPDCGKEQLLELAPRWRSPQPVTCRFCHRGHSSRSRRPDQSVPS